MTKKIERREPVKLSDETFAIIVAVSALSRAIDPSGEANRQVVEMMRAGAGLARVDAPTREAVLAVADFMEAGQTVSGEGRRAT